MFGGLVLHCGYPALLAVVAGKGAAHRTANRVGRGLDGLPGAVTPGDACPSQSREGADSPRVLWLSPAPLCRPSRMCACADCIWGVGETSCFLRIQKHAQVLGGGTVSG